MACLYIFLWKKKLKKTLFFILSFVAFGYLITNFFFVIFCRYVSKNAKKILYSG